MHLLFAILLIFLFIPSYFCQNNITYVFSHINTSTISTILNSNGFILTNSSYVKRLSSSGAQLLNSTQTILSANNIQSIAFSWNTGDCSFPLSVAATYGSINVSSPICVFQRTLSSITNFLQLTTTSKQLASAAAVFMTHNSLNYFSIIISSSSDFYFNLAQEFSTYLVENNYILEQFLFVSNFPSSLTSTSKG
jgi:hypothetical protein